MDNTHSHTFFIVDEASMIGSSSTADGTDLLTDLIHYVYTGHMPISRRVRTRVPTSDVLPVPA